MKRRSKNWIHYTWVILSIYLVNVNTSFAQNKRVLTVDEAINIALEKSYSTKSLGLKLESAGYGLNAAKGRFKTNAQLSLQTPDFTERVTEDIDPDGLPVFNTRGTTRFQSTLNINQPLPTDGLFTLSSTFYHRNVSKFLTESSEDFNQRVFFSVTFSEFR